MDTIIAKVRDLIEDILKTDGLDTFTYESSSSSKIFRLTESNVVSSSIVVEKNGAVWASSNYSYSSTTGKLTVTGTLTAGDALEVDYNYYAKYSDSEIRGYIKSSITYLAVEKYKTFKVDENNVIFPTPTEGEEDLIALISSILIKPNLKSYRTPEISITYNEGDNKETKIKKAVRQFKKNYGVLGYIKFDEKIVDVDDEKVF